MINKGEITQIVESIEYPILKALSHLAISGIEISNFDSSAGGKQSIIGKSFRLSKESGAYKSPLKGFVFQYVFYTNSTVIINFKIDDRPEFKRHFHFRDVDKFILKLSEDISIYLKKYDSYVEHLKTIPVENADFWKFISSDRAKGYLKCSRLVETFKSIESIDIFSSCDGYVNLKYPKGYWDSFDKNEYDSSLDTFYINLDTLSALNGFIKNDNEFKYKGSGNGTFESNISCVKKIMLSYPVYFVKSDYNPFYSVKND